MCDDIQVANLVRGFVEAFRRRRPSEIIDDGGGRSRSVSEVEAIGPFEEVSGRRLETRPIPQARPGDHFWMMTDIGKFERHHPAWAQRQSMDEIVATLAAEPRGR